MNHDLLFERMHASGLSLWELGTLLGIHPHQLHKGDASGGLLGQPVRALIELARRLDLHPADLIPALDPLLTARRNPAGTTAASNLDGDALAVLTALTTTAVPLSIDELATALTWDLDRTAAALEHATDQPHLAGPVALRRIPPERWTVTARRDVLTPAQHTALAEAAYYRNPLDVGEANALLAAYRLGHTPAYAEMRPTLHAEPALKDAGLIHCDNGPHRARAHDDVRYSLDYHHDGY